MKEKKPAVAGWFTLDAAAPSLICTRCKVVWLPHSVHGMIGNCRCSAQRSRSVSAT